MSSCQLEAETNYEMYERCIFLKYDKSVVLSDRSGVRVSGLAKITTQTFSIEKIATVYV